MIQGTRGTGSGDRWCSNCLSSKSRECLERTSILESPDYLFIQLGRIPYYGGSKIETVVFPNNEIILPNGDKFRLLGIANHLGALANNGHFLAFTYDDTNWLKCDDEKISKVKEDDIISKHNYLLLYYKIDKISLINKTFIVLDSSMG